MTSKTISKKKPEKYFFGQNNFDDHEAVIEEVEEALPEPTFSEIEIETARKKALEDGYAKGKQDGINEAKADNEAEIAKALRQISRKIKPLIEQEKLRIKVYEEESVRLTLAVFQKLFPGFQKEYGFLELKKSLESILQSQQGHNHIIIQVSADLAQSIEERLGNITPFKHDRATWRVEGLPELSPGAFHLSWSDGGAIRDTDAMATEVVRLMEEALAERTANVHDKKEESQIHGDPSPITDQHDNDGLSAEDMEVKVDTDKEETDNER